MSEYATVDDVTTLWRKLSASEQTMAENLIPIATDQLRMYAKREGKDLDTMVGNGAILPSVLNSVIVDIVSRKIEENTSDTSSTLSQESQSVNGYSWSGTYVNTGGGFTVLRKDLKRLGLGRQRYGYISMLGASDEN